MPDTWAHIILEGFCLPPDDGAPCERERVSSFCLQNGHCPHLAYGDATERDAAYFVLLRLILWDRGESLVKDAYWKVWYWVTWWAKYRWKKRKPLCLGSTPVTAAQEEQAATERAEFARWYEQVKKEKP